MDHDKAIAEAASEYRSAKSENALTRSEESDTAERQAWDKLCWMLDAKKHGWNPADYEPEY